MPPSYVKPYVKRGKTDAADAEAICEAGDTTIDAVCSREERGRLRCAHSAPGRDFLIGQVMQTGNAIRGHLAEFGIVIAKRSKRVAELTDKLDALPEAARRPHQFKTESNARSNLCASSALN